MHIMDLKVKNTLFSYQGLRTVCKYLNERLNCLSEES